MVTDGRNLAASFAPRWDTCNRTLHTVPELQLWHRSICPSGSPYFAVAVLFWVWWGLGCPVRRIRIATQTGPYTYAQDLRDTRNP